MNGFAKGLACGLGAMFLIIAGQAATTAFDAARADAKACRAASETTLGLLARVTGATR